MKLLLQFGLIAVVLAAISTTGFECASSEMTSAKLYIQRKEYDNAKAQLLKEIAKNPKNEEAYYLLGKEIQVHAGRLQRHESIFRQCIGDCSNA